MVANASDKNVGCRLRSGVSSRVGRGGSHPLGADVRWGLPGAVDWIPALCSGLAARHHPDPIHAFTLTFEDAEYDEGAIAKEMAAKVGAEFHTIPIGQNDLADNFPAAIAQAETFCVNAHGVAKYFVEPSRPGCWLQGRAYRRGSG